MPILSGDLKLVQSQRMSDNTDGGGRITGNEITDGESNGIFDDVSDLDRTTGNVGLRKIYPSVHTDDTDVYMGGNVIVAEAPADPNVSVALFTTGDFDDERTASRDQMERYLVKASKSDFELLGNHYANQRQIIVIQREESDLPATGDAYVLENDEGFEQYIRVTEVEHEVRTFTYLSGSNYIDFTRRRVVLGISAPLSEDFPGGDATPTGTKMPSDSTRSITKCLDTEVADAARYYGITPLKASANLGDIDVKAESIYATLVPSAQSETPLTDIPAGYPVNTVRDASATTITDTAKIYFPVTGNQVSGFLSRPVVPGSLSMTLGDSSYFDDGSGTLLRVSGSVPFSTLEIDYVEGSLSGTRDSGTASANTTYTGGATYIPGAPQNGRAISDHTEVTINNRGYNFTRAFVHDKPRPGTMIVSYMVLGEWYTIRDPGNGILEGYGSGSVSFTTGTVAVTLQELPDVDTEIIWQYIVDIAEEFDTHEQTITDPTRFEIELTPGVEPGTLDINYTADSLPLNVGDDGAGILTGDASGSIDYGTGRVDIVLDRVPDSGTTVDVDYEEGFNQSVQVNVTPTAGGQIQGTIPGAPLKPGSVTFKALLTRSSTVAYWENRVFFSIESRITDNGVGGWIAPSGVRMHYGTIGGSIDYTTGEYTIEIAPLYAIKKGYWRYSESDNVYRSYYATNYQRYSVSNPITIYYRSVADVAAPASQVNYDPEVVKLDLLDEVSDPIAANSVLFDWAGKRYFDRDGLIYTDLDPLTGGGTLVGSISYTDHVVSLDAWPDGATGDLNLLACQTFSSELLVNEITFRTPAAPLRSQSLQITVTDDEGNIISESADLNGDINGDRVQGTVNIETGVVKLTFTDGTDPINVSPNSSRYNAILYSFLPLDAELIGLDPVRLPSDGRVPIFRPGDVAVIHHSDEEAFPPGVIPGQTLDVGRIRLSECYIVDAVGERIPTDRYTVDLDLGIITLADPLDTSGYSQPWKAIHRVEDMSLVGDIDINGTISFTRPISHDYPVGSYISSAMVIGDLQARVTNLFDQSTWTSVFSDSVIGGEPTSEYNDALYPVEVTNRGSLQQRWALVFTSSTSFRIVGETVGEIGNGTTGSDCAPNNPNTNVPYFVVKAGGWGLGWSAGNVLRFNTYGAAYPIWVARTVMQSEPAGESDAFRVQIRGNVNA